MCRIEERVYIGMDGSRRTFEDPYPCHKSKHGKLCSSIKRRTTEYFPKQAQVTRDRSSSPASIDPPTPTGTGSYVVEQRRPSIVDRRPSIRQAVKPEIIIEFGTKKSKSKKYPGVSVKTYKRTSLGTPSIDSNDAAVESPGSDASFTVRTGLAETPVPYQQPPSYTTRPALPQSHHRHTSSASSFTTSSQPPSLYATSEPDSPTGRRAPRYPPTIVHNPPPSPTATRAIPVPGSSAPYRTIDVAPQDSTPRSNIGPDGLFPLDYSSFHDHSGSSHASSGRAAAPEITDRDAERARLRKLKAEAERKRQEENDRQMAQELAQQEAHARAQEEAKQVRFELGRAEGRAKERGEAQFAESEKRRVEDREEARRRKKTEDERDERAPKESKKVKGDKLKDGAARKEKPVKETEVKQKRDSRPPTRDPNAKRHARRPSITRAEAQERSILLAETEAQMAREREATEQREREERATILRQQQQTAHYWDPRGGDRYPATVTTESPGVGRRNSVSARRPSVSGVAPPPMGLGRTNSQARRVSIIQSAPPPNLPHLNTTFPNQYSTRPPSSHHQNQTTPLFSSGTSGQTFSRPPSARHSSYSQDNPFAQPPTRTSQENPFAATTAPPMPQHDPWDTRNVREALPQVPMPQVRQTANIGIEQPHTLKRRGEDVIARAAQDRVRPHDRARQATRDMGKAVGYEEDYISTDEENEADKIAGYGPRLGLGVNNHDKRRN